MDDIVKLLIGLLIAGDLIWRVARIVNGDSATAAFRVTSRPQLILILVFAAVIFGLMAINAGIPGKVSSGILCAAAVVTLILVLIFGGLEEPPVNRPPTPSDPPADSN